VGDRLDLDHGIALPEPGDPDARHRRVLGSRHLSPPGADLPPVRLVVVDVGEVDGHVEEVGRGAAGGTQRRQHVAEGLRELLEDPPLDDPARGVQSRLAGQVDERSDAHGVREAARLDELGWVDDLPCHDTLLVVWRRPHRPRVP
jgi:hypothetical protein